ncbi:MAG: hypothetical protein ACLSVD_15915 [Eggerthellaceae bacterium]
MDEHVSHHDTDTAASAANRTFSTSGTARPLAEERERLAERRAVMTKGTSWPRSWVEPQAQQNGRRDSTTANSTCANTSIARTNTRFGWGAVAK